MVKVEADNQVLLEIRNVSKTLVSQEHSEMFPLM